MVPRAAAAPVPLAILAALVAAIIAAMYASPVAAQSVRGTVVDRRDVAVGGVVVVLLDSAQATVARAITDDAGGYLLRAPSPGAYRIRTLRIGFTPVLGEPLTLSAGETRVARTTLDGVRVVLGAMQVVARRSCDRADVPGAPGEAETMAAWAQATGAMTAAALAGSDRGVVATIARVGRDLDASGRRVRSERTSTVTELVREPWRSHPVEALRRNGYVVSVGDSLDYYAPGLDVLTSPQFLRDHCLRLVTGRDQGEIGVAFEPTPERRALPDVRGTVWLRREDAELTRVSFTFTSLPASVGRVNLGDRAGGSMRFARLSTGTVVITEWELRMPVLTRMTTGGPVRVDGLSSTGGRLLLLRRGAETVYRAGR